MNDYYGKCPGCGGPRIPLFLSLVCRQECDLKACTPLQLDQTEGDSDWAGRMMVLDTGAIMRCIGCCCSGSACEGVEYRVNNYTGQVMYMGRSGSAWLRVSGVMPDDVELWFPKVFRAHRWRNVGSS